MYTEQLTERLGIGPALNPQILNSGATATGNAGPVDMTKFHRALFIVEIGTVVSGGSITAQLIEDSAANLGTATNLGGSNTSMTLTTSNKQYTFEVRADQMTKRYLGLSLTETGGHNVTLTAIAFGDEASHKPGKAANDSSVVTQNVVS